MVQINLIPTDLAPKPSVVRTSGVVKQILVVGLIIFIIAGAVIGGLSYMYSRQLSESVAALEEIKINIQALQATEQRLLLVRDRLVKAKMVLGMATTADEVDSATTLLSGLPEGTVLTSAEFQAEETNLTLSSQNTTVLTQTTNYITSSGIYANINMSEFNFAPETGFKVEFKLTK